MPIYEYECESCKARFEKRQPVTAEPLKECPRCGAAVHRVIFPVGIIFKGSGFYTTDNRKLPAGEKREELTAGGDGEGPKGKEGVKESSEDRSE